jgi:predicted Zn-dependent peptidase
LATQFHQHRLPNGLTVIAEANPDAHTAAVGFFVKTGARDEDAPVMGVSHFLEHMMFKGTARRTADDVNREFDEIGASYNAFTSHENTVYHARVLPEHLPHAVDLLGDMLRPALRDDDFDMEKNVILEEISMYDDRPQWRLHDTLIEKHFTGSPLGHRVLGTAQTVKDLQVDQMRGYFEDRYSPDNITVAAAGRIGFDDLLKDVEKIAGSWQPTGAKRSYGEPTAHDQDFTLTDAKLNRHYVAMMCPAPSSQDPRRYAAKVLADVLGDDDGSRLYWALVDPGLADEADLSYYSQDQIGSFVAFASCDPERAAQVEPLLLKTLDDYAAQIDAAEIDRAKNKLATLATLQDESPGGRMRSLGMQWTYLGAYTPLSEELERLMAVSADDVRSLVTQMPFRPRTVARLGP